MKEFQFIVTVMAETEEEALQVIAERIDFDEDYSFEYRIDWTQK